MRKNPQGFALRYNNGKQRLSVVAMAVQIHETRLGRITQRCGHSQEWLCYLWR
jgi:hypothetical protein